jgi:multidrug efflux system membrane fusion protein
VIDPGNIVHASAAAGMVVIAQLQPISVLFTIPEDSLPEVMRFAASACIGRQRAKDAT